MQEGRKHLCVCVCARAPVRAVGGGEAEASATAAWCVVTRAVTVEDQVGVSKDLGFHVSAVGSPVWAVRGERRDEMEAVRAPGAAVRGTLSGGVT